MQETAEKTDEKDFAFWMYEATDWKTAADQAWKTENTEWLYICCVNLATLIYKKVLVHPNLTNELSPPEIDILQKVCAVRSPSIICPTQDPLTCFAQPREAGVSFRA